MCVRRCLVPVLRSPRPSRSIHSGDVSETNRRERLDKNRMRMRAWRTFWTLQDVVNSRKLWFKTPVWNRRSTFAERLCKVIRMSSEDWVLLLQFYHFNWKCIEVQSIHFNNDTLVTLCVVNLVCESWIIKKTYFQIIFISCVSKSAQNLNLQLKILQNLPTS